jgi:hypothetical protein
MKTKENQNLMNKVERLEQEELINKEELRK